MDQLVPGRECGECGLCCIVPAIDKPEIQKLPNAACMHCGNGCAIYDSRPDVCRKFYCGWRRIAILGEEWRPDRSGVFAQLEYDGIPPQCGKGPGISLTLVGNPLKSLREPRFVDFVAQNVTRNIAVFLGLPGPRGMLGGKILVNGREMSEAVKRSRGQVKALLEKALKKLAAHEFQPHVMEHDGADVSM